MDHVRRYVVADFTRVVGSHDDPAVFAEPAGDPGLMGPGSISWEIHSDASAIAAAGIAAIMLELLHPSVMAGVGQHSGYREDPYRRARSTFGWVITTTFAGTATAERMIEGVKRMHARVNGTRDDGVPYRALDPTLIAWVHTAIPWAIMTAYERFNRPLTIEEKDRYLDEQSIVASMSGADAVPRTVAELDGFVASMRPQLEAGAPFHEFLGFLASAPFGSSALPSKLARPAQRFQIEAGVSLMPRWAQQMTGYDRPEAMQQLLHRPSLHAYTRLLRWAMGTPPWRQLAEERVRPPHTHRTPTPVARATRLRGAPTARGHASARRS